MSLTVGTREVDGVTIVDLSGRITLGDTSSGKLRETVKELLGSGAKKILLNLGDVSYIDSSGLRSLRRLPRSLLSVFPAARRSPQSLAPPL